MYKTHQSKLELFYLLIQTLKISENKQPSPSDFDCLSGKDYYVLNTVNDASLSFFGVWIQMFPSKLVTLPFVHN